MVAVFSLALVLRYAATRVKLPPLVAFMSEHELASMIARVLCDELAAARANV
jgi:predicted Kef-type K+ transport protein